MEDMRPCPECGLPPVIREAPGGEFLVFYELSHLCRLRTKATAIVGISRESVIMDWNRIAAKEDSQCSKSDK